MNHKAAVECVRRFVRSLGGAVYLTGQSQRVHGTAGIPDMECFVPLRCVASWCGHIPLYYESHSFHVEVKVGRDKLSEAQKDYIYWKCMSGGTVIVARDDGSKGPANTVREWLGIEEG